MAALVLLTLLALGAVVVRLRPALRRTVVLGLLVAGCAAHAPHAPILSETKLGTTRGPAEVSGGLGVAVQAGSWTPERASGLTFDLDPGTASTLTLSGSTVTQAKSKGGGSYTLVQSGSATLPTLDTSNKIGGWPTLATTSTGALFSAVGPTIGSDTAFNLYAVAQLTSNVGASYPAILTLGNATPTTDQDVYLGGRTTQWWAGCQDATLGAIGGAVDGNAHLFGMEYDGSGHFTLRVDGVLTAGPTSCTFNAHASFPVGFGVAPQYSGNTTAFRLARGIFRLSGLDSTTVRRLHERYLAIRYGLLITDEVMGVGDSLTHGTGSSNPPATGYLGQLSAQTPLSGWTFSYFDDGHPGFSAGSILSAMTSQNLCSGSRKNSVVIVFAGTNDVAQSIATTTTTANLGSIKSTLEGAGCTVLFGTLYPWDGVQPFGWSQTAADAINSWIRSNIAATKIIEWANTPEMQLSSGTYQATYRNCDGCSNAGHPTDAGYAAMARDAAPVIFANKMSIAPGGAANDTGFPLAAGLALVVAGTIVQRRRTHAPKTTTRRKAA